MRKSIALGIAAAFVSGGIAIAAQQGAAAKKLLLHNPPSGNTKIVYLSKNTTATVAGNPIANGASFNVVIGGDGTQCMSMPASGWSAISTIGFKYDDFLRLAAIFAAIVPLVWLMRRRRTRPGLSRSRSRLSEPPAGPRSGRAAAGQDRPDAVPRGRVTPRIACPAAARLRGTSRAEASLSTTTRRTSARARSARARAAP